MKKAGKMCARLNPTICGPCCHVRKVFSHAIREENKTPTGAKPSQATLSHLGMALLFKSGTRCYLGLPGVMRGRGSSFQPMAIPNRALAAITGHFEVLRQFQTIRGASIFAQSAKHAARSIIRKSSQNFAPRSIVAQPAHHNQILRTS